MPASPTTPRPRLRAILRTGTVGSLALASLSLLPTAAEAGTTQQFSAGSHADILSLGLSVAPALAPNGLANARLGHSASDLDTAGLAGGGTSRGVAANLDADLLFGALPILRPNKEINV